jgi:hypothetical protein
MPVVRISVVTAADADAELRRLNDWLREEDALRGRVDLERAAPGPGQMGFVTQALLARLDDAGDAAAMSQSLDIYLRLRGPEVKLMIQVGGEPLELSVSTTPEASRRIFEDVVRAIGTL